MIKGAEYNSTQELGLGLLHWPSYTEALIAKVAMSYRDQRWNKLRLESNNRPIGSKRKRCSKVEKYSPRTQKSSNIKERKEERQNDSRRTR